MVNILNAIASQCIEFNKMNPFLLFPHLLSPNTYRASLLNNVVLNFCILLFIIIPECLDT